MSSAASAVPDNDPMSTTTTNELTTKLAKLDLALTTEPSLDNAAASAPLSPLERVCQRIATGDIRRIVVLTGAGCSTSAGLPDFRSPDSGIYAQIGEDVFRLSYFRDKPEAFYALARELYPDGARYRPTCTHWFIKLLQDRGCLLRNVTQNIDGLDLATGLSVGEHVVQAHGGFDRAACIECEAEGDAVQVRAEIMAGRIPRCTNCYDGLVKPAITFFGESLPEAFAKAAKEDLPVCDLLIVIGTSLQVQPFGGLINLVGDHVPRILINREPVGELMPRALQDAEYQAWRERLDYVSPDSCMREQIRQELARILQRVGGFQFRAHPERDIFLPGECDASVRHLAALIGDAWATQLEALVQAGAKTTPKQD